MKHLSIIVALLAAHSSVAQDYPKRPVRLLVGLGPGGGSDTVARVLTQKLTDVFGQTFVVDNRPSAGGTSAEFSAYVKTEFDKWAKVVKISGVKAE